MRPFKTMVGGSGGLSTDMLLFIETPVAQPLVKGRNLAMAGSLGVAVLLFVVLRQFAFSGNLALLIAFTTLAVNATVVMLRYANNASTPLAVNLNHPFVDEEPLGQAKVLIRLANGEWIDPGPHRVRTVPEELLGGCNLVQDTDDYPVLGHFVEKKDRNGTLARHLALINQAIALRDAVNEVPDPIESARKREAMDTGLLERSWLEDEDEVQVESPLVSFFRGKE